MSEIHKEDNSNSLPDNILEMHAAAMREMSEPRDGVRPTPVSYLVLCLFWTMWGGWYLGTYGGSWTGNGLSETSSGAANAAPVVAQDPMQLGAEVYNACLQCHQGNGKGLEGQFPPLSGSEFVTGDPRRFAAILMNGINGPFTVNGAVYNSQMPAWKDSYNDEEMAAVMTYVRNSFGNKAAPVSKTLVEAVRKEVAAQGTWTEDSLKAFAASAPTPSAAAPTPAPGK